jgi:transcriptional regulator with XRE-family HTH domain
MQHKTLQEVRQDLAFNLKAIRAERGLAQERLALDAGVDRTVVSKIERAKTNPSLDVLLRLANHLETSVDCLLKAHKHN